MKTAIFLFLITITFVFSASAQSLKPEISALPTNIADWKGEDSDKILENAIIQKRLKKLLGKKNYESFMESFETAAPIEKYGDFLFSSGCLIHACQHLESAIAIDLVNKTIHAAIYREDEKTKYFNEGKTKIPESIENWSNRLDSLNK